MTNHAASLSVYRGIKQATLTTAEINGNMQFSCSYTETQGNYGTVQVNNSLEASHTPATADANDVFAIENGMLKVTTSTTNGTDYVLNVGTLRVNNGFSGTLTSTATFNNDAQTREIDFIYGHNGMRTAKIVSENGRVETTEYTLHGKFITHMTKRTVDENGEESTEELHFFYDAQSRPAFVEYDGAMYRYVHNLQGDIVAIVDAAGNLVVEYKYDAWGKPFSTTGCLKTTLAELNPYRYRGYVWDEETVLLYINSRYYSPVVCKFSNADCNMGNMGFLLVHTLFCYCNNNPIMLYDPTGYSSVGAVAGGFLGGPVGVIGGIIGELLIVGIFAGIRRITKSQSKGRSRSVDPEPQKYRLALAVGNGPVIAIGDPLSKSEVYLAVISGLVTKNNVRREYDAVRSGDPPKGRLRIGILSMNQNDAREVVSLFGEVTAPHPNHVGVGLPHYHIDLDHDIHFWYMSE